MESFANDRDRLNFLFETEAEFVQSGALPLRAIGIAAPGPAATAEDRPKYVTNYIGSKQKLVDWIWENAPQGVTSALDGFSGSSVVAYLFKTKGLRVLANDRLRLCHHIARAIIENESVKLSEAEIDSLATPNPKAGSFVRDNFDGLFFQPGVHQVIDEARANVDRFAGYKKDIALFALAKTCMSGGFGHFTSTGDSGMRKGGPDEFRERLRSNAAKISDLVFASGQKCQASRQEIAELLPEAKVDLAYFDPPYATEFSTTNYEKAYHFVEGLMTNWEGLEIKSGSKTRSYETNHETVTKANAGAFFAGFLSKAAHIPNWMISYRDKAYPTDEEMKQLIAAQGMTSRLETHDHHYMVGGSRSDSSDAKEYLFICTKGRAGASESDAEIDLRVESNLSALAEAPLGEAVDLLSCQAGLDPVRVTGFMGNKYLMLGWIERHVPKESKTLLDAFSGGANVAYHFKRRGLRVIANDILRYPFHIARAVVENSTETLSPDEVDRVLTPNPDSGSFIVENFAGYYYTRPVLRWLDQVWANIQQLPGYKRDIALAALGNTVKAKASFGSFSRSKIRRRADDGLEAEARLDSQVSNPPVAKFVESFRRSVAQLNALVFDNGQECRATNLDALEAVRRFGADVLYLDPPAVTASGGSDYEDSLHFVEGLMTRWADKEILDNPRRSFRSRTRYSRESIRELLESLASESRTRFGSVLLSYSGRALPDEEGIRGMLAEHFGLVRVRGVEVDLGAEGNAAPDGGSRELLFVASKGRTTPRAVRELASAAACHTSFPVELRLDAASGLRTEALDLSGAAVDPQFTFVLCRAGTNKNGDHFTPDELAARHMTAINKKVDLSHSQDLTDIVGGIVSADYLEEGDGGRVECVGELYVGDSDNAQLAYKLMKKGVISQVSMECDYEEGECSICGKRVSAKGDYCSHLRKFKGSEFQGQPVFEILHGVTFTGLGLLDRKGADENARITQVASARPLSPCSSCTSLPDNDEGDPMDDPNQTDANKEGAAKKPPPFPGGDVPPGDGGGAAPPPPADDKTRVRELEKENTDLKRQLRDAQKRISELEAEQKAAANRSRAQRLLRRLEKQGVSFGSDEEREQELGRLAQLSEDAFAATEAAYDRLPKVRADEGKPPDAPADDKPRSQAATKPPAPRAEGSIRPHEVDDTRTSLEGQLKSGFMTAYRHRLAGSTGEVADSH